MVLRVDQIDAGAFHLKGRGHDGWPVSHAEQPGRHGGGTRSVAGKRAGDGGCAEAGQPCRCRSLFNVRQQRCRGHCRVSARSGCANRAARLPARGWANCGGGDAPLPARECPRCVRRPTDPEPPGAAETARRPVASCCGWTCISCWMTGCCALRLGWCEGRLGAIGPSLELCCGSHRATYPWTAEVSLGPVEAFEGGRDRRLGGRPGRIV